MSTIDQEMTFNNELAARIKQARIEANLSQTQLAELLETNQQNISAYETGRWQPSPFIISRLCRVTGKAADYFINGIKVDR